MCPYQERSHLPHSQRAQTAVTALGRVAWAVDEAVGGTVTVVGVHPQAKHSGDWLTGTTGTTSTTGTDYYRGHCDQRPVVVVAVAEIMTMMQGTSYYFYYPTYSQYYT